MIDTDQKKIHEVLSRGVEHVYPSREYVAKLLASGKKLKIYLGIDPTGPTLHIGHAVQLKKLRDLQRLGHEVILLIGDFTAMIGDPTDKSAARKQLTRKEVLQNSKQYKKQASLFLDFGFGKAKFAYNSKWFDSMKFLEVVKLASKMTVQQMLERDMFQKRMNEGKPIYLHEFLYPLMQGYDSIALGVDGEIGGNDQTFNMLAGRNLAKEMTGKEKFVMTMKLLEDTTGKKMGKTEGNMISLTDDGYEMFGKVMSWTDGMIIPGFELCTDISSEEIRKIEKNLDDGSNPRDAKMRLASEIVTIYHGSDAAKKAENNFIETFKKGGLPENLEEIKTEAGKLLIDILSEAKIVASKSEFRRLISEGAISNAETGEKITDSNFKIEKEIALKVGKKRFIKITL